MICILILVAIICLLDLYGFDVAAYLAEVESEQGVYRAVIEAFRILELEI